MVPGMPHFLLMLHALALILAAAAAFHPALARDEGVAAGPWVAAHGSQARLLVPTIPWAVGMRGFAGVEIRLAPGAKTYWRFPGDTGVPPEFDFSASKGAAEAAATFPAPSAFDDGAGGVAYGYPGDVVFPLRFTVTEASATLAVAVDYGVCLKNMCVPAHVKLSAPLAGGVETPGAAEALLAAVKRVPRKSQIGGGGPVAIDSAATRIENGRLILEVRARVPAGEQPTLFVEQEEPFGHPARTLLADGLFAFTAERPAARGKREGTARLTLVAPGEAVEAEVALDPAK